MKNIFTFFVLIIFISNLPAQLNHQAISIPMRDGKSLAADLYLPNQTDTFPVILIQTPYNKNFYKLSGLPLGIGTNQSSSNYAFVIVDWRCFWGSAAACILGPKRGEDGYDAVEWIAQQTWCNGKIGTWGPSALGNVQFETAKKQPPSLVCAVPQVSSPQIKYTRYYSGGVLKTEYTQTLGTLFGPSVVVNYPHYNWLWQSFEDDTMYPDSIEIPMLLVEGWYDHAIVSNLEMVDTLLKNSAPAVRNEHKLLIGPWVHGGTSQATVGSNIQGELTYPLAAKYNDSIELQFFDYYMRGINNGYNNNARYMYYQMGEDTWENSPVWPPVGAQDYTFYLHDNNTIDAALPTSTTASLNYNYDPTDPSPTLGGKTLGPATEQGPYDQADSIESRSDALVFTTAPFTQDMILRGKVKVNLFVESDRIDTDFAIRLTEVYPDNRSMLLDHGIQRMRFRNGYYVADTAMMVPGQVYPITIELEDLANTFKVGQRLRIVVTSSNYPLYNRNMNTGGEMYPGNSPDSLENPVIANNTIHLSSSYPSSIELPLYNYNPSSTDKVVQQLNSFELYPNPSRGLLTLTKLQQGSQLNIRNLLGRNVFQQKVQQQKMQLDLKHLPAGIYLISTTTATGVIQSKELILQH